MKPEGGKVQAYVNPSGPEFSQIFNPTFRDVPVKTLNEEVQMLDSRLEQEKAEALANENYEVVEKLEKLRAPVQELQGEAMLLTLDDVTDSRYRLEDRKRRIAQELRWPPTFRPLGAEIKMDWRGLLPSVSCCVVSICASKNVREERTGRAGHGPSSLPVFCRVRVSTAAGGLTSSLFDPSTFHSGRRCPAIASAGRCWV